MTRYGDAPVDLGPLNLDVWDEFLHYLYLPVRLPRHDGPHVFDHGVLTGAMLDGADWSEEQEAIALWAFPPRLAFLEPVARRVVDDARAAAPHLDDPYVYVTARRGYASPGNPLNRPGWHCDDFGGTDLNYIWSDTYPTRFLLSEDPLQISDDDEQSMVDMAAYAAAPDACKAFRCSCRQKLRVVNGPAGHLLRLDPHIIHDTPEIPAPGGMRSFFKISVSSHRYNLRGNSHNHLLNYDWPMYDRGWMRNQPQGGNRDYYEETPA